MTKKARFFSELLSLKSLGRVSIIYITTSVFTRHIGEFIICQGRSMEPTISSGDIVWSEKLFLKFSNPKINDIVAFLAPHNSKIFLCKRITHKGYEKVESCPYVKKNILPKGYFFAQGDNRPESSDSRYFGPVPEGLIQVRLCLRIWPLHRIGWLSDRWFWE